jgi:hypothetical protein
MAWNILAAVERYFFASLVTLVTLTMASGLAFWIWSERFTRNVPEQSDLVEITGLVTQTMAQPRSGVVWLDLTESQVAEKGLKGVTAVRLYARDTQQLATALSPAHGAVQVTAWAARSEVEAGTDRRPPSALELRVASKTLVPYSEGRSVREEHAANGRLSAWLAGGGVVVSLAVLILFWMQRLRA